MSQPAGPVPSPEMADVPVIAGKVVRLRAVEFRDYDVLRRVELSGALIRTYRHRGVTPSPEAYARSLWADVLVNLAVCVPPVGEVVGNVACYSADFRNQHAWVSVAIAPWARGPDTFEAVELLCDYAFDTFGFRKLYFDVLEPNLAQFASLQDYVAETEARHVKDVRLGRHWVDRLVLTVWAERFDEVYRQKARRGEILARAIESEVLHSSAHRGSGASDGLVV